MPKFESGERIEELEVRERIGAGAFGTVYLAEDTLIEREVALKVVPVGDAPELEARALRELRAVGRLNHPNIVTLYRVRRPENSPVWMLEFEYMSGGTLQDRLDTAESVGVPLVCRVGSDLAAALEAAHAAGIVHGDIKPGNILLSAQGTLKVGDFGLARLTSDLSMSLSTDDGIEGTPQYLAPELVMGGRATAAADIWALGVVLYRMLAGRHPFATRNFNALFHAIQNSRPPPLPGSVPATLATLVFQCLEKQPRDRPASAAHIRAVLEGSQSTGPVPATAPHGQLLIEREKEVALVRSMLESVRKGIGRALLISGPEGMGRGALAEFASDLATNNSFLRVEASTSPVEGVLSSLVAAVRALIDTTQIPDASFDSGNSAVRRMLDSEVGPRVDDGGATTWAIELLLRAWSRERPIQVTLFDLHVADAEDMRTVRHLIRGLANARVWFVGTYATEMMAPAVEDGGSRPSVEELGALREVERLELGALSPEGILELLKDHSGAAHIDSTVLQRVHEVSEGNPGHALELLRHLEESGAVQRTNGRIGATSSFDSGALPRRLHDLATIRLEGLDETDREILDVAAADGRVFDGRAVAAVLQVPLLSVLRKLQRLYRDRGIVAPYGSAYRFASAVSQRALYNDLAPELRRELHHALAEHLEQRADVLPERVGTHWERAGNQSLAARYLREAAVQAYRRQEFHRVIRLGAHAGIDTDTLTAETLEDCAEAVFALMHSLTSAGESLQASRLGKRAIELAREAGDSTLAWRAVVQEMFSSLTSEGPAQGKESTLRQATRELPQCEELGRAWYLLGFIRKFAGATDRADEDFARAEEIYRSLQLRRLLPNTLHQRASVALRRGKLARAETLYREAATAFRNVGRRVGAATSEINAAFVALERGHMHDLEASIEKTIRTLDVEGATTNAAHARVFLGVVHYAHGFTERALRQVGEARGQLEEAGFLPGLSYACAEHAQLLGITGDLDGCREALEAANRAAESAGDRPTRAYVAALGCHLACAESDWEQARRSLKGCIDISADDQTYLQLASRGLLLAETSVYGMDPELLEPARAMASVPNVPPTIRTLIQAAIDGLLAYGDPRASPYRLLNGASALESDDIGPRRAYLRGVAALLRAEGALRQGDGEAARASGAVAERTADGLRHVWFKRVCEAWLTRADA
ncbi:MAG: protein kinase domain-containing protein [Planctomycetota bacterium]